MNSLKILKVLAVVALPLLAAACSQGGYYGMTYEMDQLKMTTPNGSPFTQALARDYLTMSQTNKDNYDWPVMSLFADKGLKASGGTAVAPEEVGNWSYDMLQSHGVNGTFFNPDSAQAQPLTEARGRLVAMLGTEAPTKFPDWSAQAQTKFDCWLEASHEAFEARMIESCRKGFEDAMTQIADGMKPVAAAASAAAPATTPAAAPINNEFLVFFDFDKSDITPEAHQVLVNVAANIQTNHVTHVNLTGHTDTVGTESYNMALSLRRANAVKRELVGMGIPADEIGVSGKGKSEPLVNTGDGVREPKNRRVQIVLPQ